MPTFASQQVAVTAQTLRTSLTLAEILSQLTVRAPNASDRTPGWRGITDELARPSTFATPGERAPEIWPAGQGPDIPERVAARYVWWSQRRVDDDPVTDGSLPWVLDGIDLLISSAAGDFLVLWSSNQSSLTALPSSRTTGSAVAALLAAVTAADPAATMSSTSVLSINRDSYLWLTNTMGSVDGIGNGIHVTGVAGMGTDELGSRRSRSSMLSGEIDLDRVSFVSAFATGTLLGPAVVEFAERNEFGRKDLTTAKIFVDGSFKLALSSCHYRGFALLGLELRLEAVHRVAFRYIPQLQTGFQADVDWVGVGKDRLLVEKQIFLSREFQRLAEANPQYAQWVAGADADESEQGGSGALSG